MVACRVLGLGLGLCVALFILDVRLTRAAETPAAQSAIRLEVLKPSIDGFDEDFATSATFVGIEQVATSHSLVIFEIPFSRFGIPEQLVTVPGDSLHPPVTYLDGGRWDQLTNPYFGVRWWSESHAHFLHEVGVRIPLATPVASDEATLAGFAAEIERLSAFVSGIAAFRYAGTYRSTANQNLGVLVRLAPEAWVTTSGPLAWAGFLAYRGMIEFHRRPYVTSVGIVGGYLDDWSGGGSVGERNSNQLEAVIGAEFGPWTPQLSLRTWLDGPRQEQVPIIVGLSLEWSP